MKFGQGEELFAVVTADGEQTLVATFDRNEWVPLVSTDWQQLVEVAKRIVQMSGRPLRVLRYGAPTEFALLTPEPEGKSS